jgi:hypothetical protein
VMLSQHLPGGVHETLGQAYSTFSGLGQLVARLPSAHRAWAYEAAAGAVLVYAVLFGLLAAAYALLYKRPRLDGAHSS